MDQIRQFAEELKKRLLECGRFRHVKAFADQPEFTGVSRSTVYDALGGRRLPSESTVVQLLRTVAVVDDEELAEWVDRRAVLAGLAAGSDRPEPVAPVVATEPTATGPTDLPVAIPAPGTTRAGWRGRAALLIAAGVVLGTIGTLGVQHLTSTAGASESCTPAPDLRPGAVAAHTTNTQGEGVYAYLAANGGCRTGFLTDGTSISVVCQVLGGKDITDTYRNAVRDWAVWDKLSSGAFVPDLYTDLPKGRSAQLVDGLPAC